jgi:hypothetical protein
MADLEDLRDAIRERGREIRDGAMDALERKILDDAPVGETGALRESVKVSPFDAGDVMGCEAEVGVDYAEYVDEGTRPHPIYGNPWLAFEVGGQKVILRADRTPVQHPGTQPTRFFSDNTNDQAWHDFLEQAQ